MAGAVEEQEPGSADRRTILRRQELEPGKCAIFAGFEDSPIKGIKSPAQISKEGAVANDF